MSRIENLITGMNPKINEDHYGYGSAMSVTRNMNKNMITKGKTLRTGAQTISPVSKHRF